MLNCRRRRKRERERERPPQSSNGDELQLKPQGNRLKKFQYFGFKLLDLPSSIIIEILTRNPIKEILNCRRVCKTLRCLISDPCFVKYFISTTPLSIVHGSRNHYHFLSLRCSGKFSSELHELKLLNTNFIPNPYFIAIIGCSNGLICFWHKFPADIEKIYITNPVLDEFAVLPNPRSDKFAALKETYGFCFCPNTGQYKVIKIKTRRAFLESNQRGYYRKTEIWILVVGINTWRYVGDAPFPYCERICHVVLNGHIHWIVENNLKGPLYLHSLDITEEQAHPVPAPPELSSETPGIELGVIGESLCLFDNSRSNHLEIWTMRKYGVATSWTKDCIVTTSIGARILRPLAVQKNGMILMSDHWGPVFSYDPKEGKFTEVYNFHGNGGVLVALYTPSFISLEHISCGDCLKVRKANSYTWKWFG